MNTYEAKQAARKARYLARAAQARDAAAGVQTHINELTRVIPPGQPILVGHHSESRHRRALETIHNGDLKAIELAEKAAHYEAKAEAVGKGGISGDDPYAMTKLRAELVEHTACQNRMKAANRLLKRGDQDGLDALGLTEEERRHLMRYQNFQSFMLTNNGANIRRIAGRIAELESIEAREDVCIEADLYTYWESGSVMFEFDGKPNALVRELLKRNGFKWSPMRGAWLRQLTLNGIAAGACVRRELDRMASGGVA